MNGIKLIHLSVRPMFKPGDLPPAGYLDWHEWTEVQRKAGIKQVECAGCGKWKTPQELSDLCSVGFPFTIDRKTGKKRTVSFGGHLCLACVEPYRQRPFSEPAKL